MFHGMPPKTSLGTTWLLSLAAFSSACGNGSLPRETGPVGGLTLSVAPLTLPGIDEACYSIEVANDGSGTSLVFGEANICSTAYGNGKGDITYIGTCDAQVDADGNPGNGTQNRVEIQLTRLSGDVGSPGDLTPDDFINPCGDDQCVLFADCVENSDTRVTFNLTVMRDANQGFFDIGVNFSDVFCSAKVDCRPEFLFNDQNQRGPTAVVAFACTAGDTGPTHMYLNDISLGGVLYDISGLEGNGDRNGDAPGGKFAVYKGQESFPNYTKYYWNVAIDIGGYTGPITTRGTASGAALVANTTPAWTRYPVIDFDVSVDNGACLANPLDGVQPDGQPSGVTTSYTSLSLTETFSNSYSDCLTGFHLESNVCVTSTRSCTVSNGTGIETWSGTWGPCTVTSCNPGFHVESNACLPDTRSCTVLNGTGLETWSGSWGPCTVTSCNAGFHVESNACVSDLRTCSVTNGSGIQTWSGTWSPCIATSCNTGYVLESGVCVLPGFQTGYLKASNTGTGDWFGYGIALSEDGNTIAVGALFEDSATTGINTVPNEGAQNAGAVYVYARANDSLPYTLQAYIKASNAGAEDGFGVAVALSSDGNTLAVGARLEDSSTTGIFASGVNSNNDMENAGAAYVYTRSGSTWSEQAYIKPSTITAHDYFAYSVALSADGNTLAVSCHGEDSSATGVNGDQTNNNAVDSGAAFIYTRSGNTWTETAYLKASNTQFQDEFSGNQLAISADGNTLVLGAHQEDGGSPGVNGNQFIDSVSNSGAAYVFVRSAGVWAQEAYLKASNPGNGDGFGYNVALSGDGNTIAIASRFEDSSANTINGDGNNNSAQDAGAVYVFAKAGGTWSEQAYLKSSNNEAGDYFGGSVALSYNGNALMAGGWLEDGASTGVGGDQSSNAAGNSGAMYRFTRTGTAWAQSAYIKASNAEGGDLFGTWVAMSSDGLFAAVAALFEAGASTGFNGSQASNSASQAGALYLFDF